MGNIKGKNICKALSNNQRANLIVCLSKPKNVSEMLNLCDLSQSALSQHLKVLKDSGVVRCTRNGKNQIYSIPDKKVLEVAKLLLKIN